MSAHTAYIALYWSTVLVAAALIFAGVSALAWALMVIGWIGGYTFRAILEG